MRRIDPWEALAFVFAVVLLVVLTAVAVWLVAHIGADLGLWSDPSEPDYGYE